MSGFSATQIIDLWERGGDLHPLDRGLTLLAAARPDMEWNRLAGLSIGERDAALIGLRRQTFGDSLEGHSACPECGSEVEFAVSLGELLAQAAVSDERSLVLADGRSLGFRLPNSFDLAALIDAPDERTLRRRLAERCLAPTDTNGDAAGSDAESADESTVVDDAVVDALSKALENADPMADIRFDLSCPDCSHGWSVALDIVTYFWDEISSEARRLLADVHLLASAYGWSESAILALSPRRRRAYLDMVL